MITRIVARLVACSLLACLLLGAIPAAADEEAWYAAPARYGTMGFDAVVLRPLAVLGLAGGSALFVPAAVMASPGGRDSIEEAWERFVILPGEQVWGRPLGDL